MENRLALVIAVDGLRASALGTYGNTSFPTPQLDELASRSLVVEWLVADSPTLAGFYGGVWQSLFPKVRQQTEMRRWLITDDPAVAQLSGENFDEVVCLERNTKQAVQEIEETHAAQFFAQAIEQLALWQNAATKQQANGLLWIHFSGLCGPWDAPSSLRRELLDEDDPLPPEFVTPPHSLQGIDDPDELLGYRIAYAAQIAVLDSCLSGFVEAFEGLPTSARKLTMLLGSRGFSLGEHGCVGHECGTLYSEQLHLPWLVLTDETRDPLPRVIGFAQPVDVGATLCEWLFPTDPLTDLAEISLIGFLTGQAGKLRELMIADSPSGEQLVRTPAWMLKRGEIVELYAKPDDRWEANDIASLCPEIVQLLNDLLAEYLQAKKAGNSTPQPSLSHVLVSPWR
jgi:hypothetical protein